MLSSPSTLRCIKWNKEKFKKKNKASEDSTCEGPFLFVETNEGATYAERREGIEKLPLDYIVPDPDQPRKEFDERNLKELSESINQQGLLQPILVRPVGNDRYQLVSGERRFKACKMLGMKTILAEIMNLSDDQVREIQLVENLQRKDLSPLEEAEALQKMIELGYTHEKLGNKIGKSREYVTNKLRLLKLPENIRKAVQEGKITESHARALIPLDENKRNDLLNKALAETLSVRQVEEAIKSNNVSRETPSSLDTKDGLIIGVWISSETYSVLQELVSSKKTSLEKFCSQIIEQEVIKPD